MSDDMKEKEILVGHDYFMDEFQFPPSMCYVHHVKNDWVYVKFYDEPKRRRFHKNSFLPIFKHAGSCIACAMENVQ